MTKLSQFEMNSTLTKQKLKIMTRVFFALFINTAILTLLVNVDMQDNSSVKGLPFSKYILNGNYKDFSRNWYIDVGSIIIATMIVNAISPHYLNLIFWYPIGLCWRRFCWKFYKTQESLNEMYAGTDFNIATRSSQILTTVFSCYLYSGGMPILNIICFFTLFSIYWIDKTLVLKHYRKPPGYSADLNEKLISFLPFAVVFHCGFSLYSYGASDIFPSSVSQSSIGSYVQVNSVSLSERIYRKSGIINLVLILISLLFFGLKMISFEFCRRKNAVHDARARQGSYSAEVEKIKSQGLHSYDIMENSLYRPLVISFNSAVRKNRRSLNSPESRKEDNIYRKTSLDEDCNNNVIEL